LQPPRIFELTVTYAVGFLARVSAHREAKLSIGGFSFYCLAPNFESNQVSQEGRDKTFPACVPGFAHHFAAI
jgi:hypothetical protein